MSQLLDLLPVELRAKLATEIADLEEVFVVVLSLLFEDSQACLNVLLSACAAGSDQFVSR